MHRISLFVFLIITSPLLHGQQTFYTTGTGTDIDWDNVTNWTLDAAGLQPATAAPTDLDNVIINHDISQTVPSGYIFSGNVFVAQGATFSINSGAGTSNPYIFAGDTFRVAGNLVTSSDFENQVFMSAGTGLLQFDSTAVFQIGDDLILNANSETIIDNQNCGLGAAVDDLYFKGTSSLICGEGKFYVPDAIRVWDDADNEISPDIALQLIPNGQVCPGFRIYGTPADCELEINAIFEVPILPVEWLGLDAELNYGRVHLAWETLTELNNDFFSVERSFDGLNFEKIGQLEGQVYSNEPVAYSFTDHFPMGGEMIYRIRQTDIDGKSSFSPRVAVQVPHTTNISVFPNPQTDAQFTLRLEGMEAGSKARITMFQLTGQVVFDREETLSHPTEEISFNQELAPGMYWMKVQTSLGTFRQQVLKQ